MQKGAQSDSEACGSGLIDAEIAFSADLYAHCYGLASAGQPSGLDLGALPFQAQTSRVTGFLGPGEQASPGEGVDTSMWMVSTFLD
jgi:hypothetical protein